MTARIWLWIGAIAMGYSVFTEPGTIASVVFPAGATIIWLALLKIEKEPR